MNKKALYNLTYGLFIISAADGKKNAACVVNTVIQVSGEPVTLSVAVSKNNYTHDVLLNGKKCAISVLGENVSMDTIRHFGFQSGTDTDKLAQFPHQTAQNGAAYITDGAIAYFSGHVKQTLDIGTHTIFIIEVEEADTLQTDAPMTYAYYQKVKKGTSPKNAPTYDASAGEEKKGWRCSICGYIAEMDELPDDYTCPICKQPKEYFVKL